MLCLFSLDVVKATVEDIVVNISAQHEAAQRVKAHKAEIPLCVYQAVLLLGILRGELSKTRQRASNLLALFRIQLGVSPRSKFRMTEAGSVHIDILRTIVHSCSAARVEIKDYLLFVFKNRLEIEANPTNFTPFAYAL